MKKFYLTLLLSAMTFIAFAGSFYLTEKEQKAMLEEAEDWIDAMPDGLQDRLSDAVAHARHGFYQELDYFRNYADTAGVGKYPVMVKEISGGELSNIPMRVYRAANADKKVLPLLIYFHGGGWSMGSTATTEKFCRALVSEGNVMVVSMEYPLAPQNTFPKALESSKSAVEYIYSKAGELGSDASEISLGGDGAGGNIALTVWQELPETVKVKSLVLYYPILNVEGPLDAGLKRQYGRGYGFDSRLWEAYTSAYAGKNIPIDKNLPPTLLISAGRDIILNEEQDFSSRKGVTYIEFSGSIHGFITDGHQSTAFKKAVALTNEFLNV